VLMLPPSSGDGCSSRRRMILVLRTRGALAGSTGADGAT
jgi:hypothetical protein